MGAVPVNSDDVRGRGLVEQIYGMCCEQKEVSNGAMGEGQGLGSSEEDESRINEATQDVRNGAGGLIQVVSALLRNCCYEVTAVGTGIQAWKILEDPTNHMDLILTEVVMPLLTGIGLLSKIMSHKTLKNVPVIMMSSHDSMGIVFKCLSKGAVDFLVKPIRKNELKNLWQHVWRRCHSSSGSGSESGTQTRKSANSKSNDESDNNTGSSDEHDNGSNGPSIQDGSDNGSGTQSSWTKRVAEVESPQPMSPPDQIADAPDSTCAQVIHTKPEKFSNRRVHVTETKECPEQDEQLGVSKDPECQHEMLSMHLASRRQNQLPEADSKPFDSGQQEQNSEILASKPANRSSNIVSAVINSTDPEAESRDFDIPNGLSDISQIKAHSDSRQLPSLELTLKRLREDVGNIAHDDRNVLRHSDVSAFSKYNTASSANSLIIPTSDQAHTGNVGSCSPLDNGLVALNTETMHNFPSHSSGTLPNQQSNGSSNNIDMASTNKCVIPKPEIYDEKPESVSAFKSFNSSAFQSVQNSCISSSQQVSTVKAADVEVNKIQAQMRGSQQEGSEQQVQVQHHHHHHHHYHHHVHNMQQRQLQPDREDLSQKNMAGAAQQCGSSNVLEGPIESNAGNYSVNGSASGSNYGCNGQNGSSTALNAGVTNVESENGAGGSSGAGGVSGKNGGNGADEGRVAHRVAALNKFRQKRKERCFEKKVRYHSRKKLAEQRPRIRGQFVRQITSDAKAGIECESKDDASGDDSYDGVQ
ncbi:hypothetical protein SLA2020_449540 [Shorea laevis]